MSVEKMNKEPIFEKLSDCLLNLLGKLTEEDEQQLKKGYYVATRKKEDDFVYYLKLKKIKLSVPK